MTEPAICLSCSMPLRRPEDHGGGRTDNPYCIHCTDIAGKLKPYADVLEGMTQFAIRTMGVTEEEAHKTAKENMSKMPAWAERSK